MMMLWKQPALQVCSQRSHAMCLFMFAAGSRVPTTMHVRSWLAVATVAFGAIDSCLSRRACAALRAYA